ncbi:hypothetical protein I79_019030 [Cricetulus griseus]|uniref:Uncharacterized protein n=1 Tax=Cricetulus griseus TaxID=10029 RepID=G3I6B6_CRIGR|nr:hypothetical protein I79_019030 [Cricetulus griseus]
MDSGLEEQSEGRAAGVWSRSLDVCQVLEHSIQDSDLGCIFVCSAWEDKGGTMHPEEGENTGDVAIFWVPSLNGGAAVSVTSKWRESSQKEKSKAA